MFYNTANQTRGLISQIETGILLEYFVYANVKIHGFVKCMRFSHQADCEFCPLQAYQSIAEQQVKVGNQKQYPDVLLINSIIAMKRAVV